MSIKQKVVNNSHALRWRLVAFALLTILLAALFTLLMFGYLGPIEPLARLLSSPIEKPQPFGWFHFVWIGFILLATFLLLKFCGHFNDRKYRLVIFSIWLVTVIFELLKQFSYYYYYQGETLVANYLWCGFPFQFCSLSLYVLPFVFLLNDGKVRHAMEMFAITFVSFGGIANYIYPIAIFDTNIFINIQTMVDHGLLIVASIYIAFYRRHKLNLQYFLYACLIFIVSIIIAVILNETIYHVVPEVHAKLPGDTFSMFFISPYFPSIIPILSLLQPLIPNALYVIIYAICFTVIAYVILILYSLIINHQIKPCWRFTPPSL